MALHDHRHDGGTRHGTGMMVEYGIMMGCGTIRHRHDDRTWHGNSTDITTDTNGVLGKYEMAWSRNTKDSWSACDGVTKHSSPILSTMSVLSGDNGYFCSSNI